MSTWRRKAIECFPDLQGEFEQSETTLYTVFFELLPRVRDAHVRNDTEELQRIYGYAEWCSRQRGYDLGNAAGVAFYEHLVDSQVTFRQIPRWLPPDIFEAVKSLFQMRLTEGRYEELCDLYYGLDRYRSKRSLKTRKG
jgi:hypothetical protein